MNKKFEPFIQSILHPDLENVDGLNELTTEELVKAVAGFSDEEILSLVAKNPSFTLNPRAFGILQDKGERLSEVMISLMNRFSGAKKNINSSQTRSCKHDPSDSYGLEICRSRLNWIKNKNPKIYRIYNRKGKLEKEVGEFYQKEIDEAIKEGQKVELRNNQEIIGELSKTIEGLEKQIAEHKQNCK